MLAKEVRRKRWRQVKEVFLYVYDPLWGEFELSHVKEGEKFSRRQMLAYSGFAACPCLMVTCGCFRSELHKGLSKAEVRRAWRRLLLSGSFIFGAAMIVILLAQVCIHGHAPFSENPMLGPPVASFQQFGARNAASIRYNNEWWRLVTPIFLHGGWLHLLANISIQLRTCLVLECLWGSAIWLIIFLGSGVYASLASCIFLPDHLGVGASGAICGIIGAWLPFILITWNQTTPNDRQKRNAELAMVVLAIVILIPTSFAPMTDYAAHLGGLVMGMAIATTLFARRLQSTAWKIGVFVSGLMVQVGLVAFSVWWFFSQVNPSKALLRA